MATSKISVNNIVLKEYIVSVTVAANSFAANIVDITLNGYKPIALCGFDSGGMECVFYRARLSGNTIKYGLRNLTAAEHTMSTTFVVAYQQT